MRTREQQRAVDEEHVRLLAIFYFISGGFTSFFGFFSLMYVAMGAMALLAPGMEAQSGEAFGARSIGALFTAIGLGFFIGAQVFAAGKILTGYWLMKRRRRVPCLVVAGLTCLGIPYGTILGVFTFVVLLRDSVRELFEEAEMSPRPRAESASEDSPVSSSSDLPPSSR